MDDPSRQISRDQAARDQAAPGDEAERAPGTASADSASGHSTRPSSLGLVVAVAVALTGAVWLLQGLGVLTAGGSFMIGDPTWAVIGASFIGAGVMLGIRARRRAS